MRINTYYKHGQQVYDYFRVGYKPYINIIGLYYKQALYLRSSVLKGDHVSEYPYETATVITAVDTQNAGRNGFHRLTGDIGSNSFGLVNEVKYMKRFEYSVPTNFINYPLNYQNELTTLALNQLANGTVSYGTEMAESLETTRYLLDKTADILGVLRSISKGELHVIARRFGFSKKKSRRTRIKMKKAALLSDRVSKSERLKWRRSVDPLGLTKSLTDEAAVLWLEARYAIRPLIYSVEDYRKAKVFGQNLTTDVLTTSRGKVTENLSSSKSVGTVRYQVSGTATHRMKIRFKILDRDALALLASDLNTSIVAWELTPFSFLVDQAFNVGDWLKAVQVFPLVEFLSGSQSIKVDARVTYTNTKASTKNGGYYDTSSRTVTVDAYKRFVLRSISRPLPQMDNPFKDFADVSTALDIFAIFFTGGPRYHL